MTFGGIAPSGYFATINIGGGIGRTDYEPASGDATGLVDNLVVVRIQGTPVSPTAPAFGHLLQYNGLAWTPTETQVVFSGITHNLLSATHADTVPASPSIGDIISGSGSSPTRWVRFPVGLQGQQLRVTSSSNIAWSYDPVQIVSGVTTVSLTTENHKVVVNQGSGISTTVNLPSGAYLGQEMLVKDGRGDANIYPISVVPHSGSTIDGLSAFLLSNNYQSMTFMWNGSNWNII